MIRYLHYGKLALFALFLLSPYVSYGDQKLEHLKAAYILNLSKFVKWPEEKIKSEKFYVCIYGSHQFGKALNFLSTKSIHRKPIAISYPSAPDEVEECHVLYISKVNQNNFLKDIALVNRSKNILTISDVDKFYEKGGIVTLTVKEGRLKFIINIAASKEANLKVSSQLLEVAEVVGN